MQYRDQTDEQLISIASPGVANFNDSLDNRKLMSMNRRIDGLSTWYGGG